MQSASQHGICPAVFTSRMKTAAHSRAASEPPQVCAAIHHAATTVSPGRRGPTPPDSMRPWGKRRTHLQKPMQPPHVGARWPPRRHWHPFPLNDECACPAQHLHSHPSSSTRFGCCPFSGTCTCPSTQQRWRHGDHILANLATILPWGHQRASGERLFSRSGT